MKKQKVETAKEPVGEDPIRKIPTQAIIVLAMNLLKGTKSFKYHLENPSW